MANRVFFSFHYQDVLDFRANVVRNHWVTKPDREAAGYFDASIWEDAKKSGDLALKRLINSGLSNTSNTCVLIGTNTYARPWVRYEIAKSFIRGNHLFALHINGIKDKDQRTKPYGLNPLDYLAVTYSEDGRTGTLVEYRNQKWFSYAEVDSADTFKTAAEPRRFGKTYLLSELFQTYDWVQNDGYENFQRWLR